MGDDDFVTIIWHSILHDLQNILWVERVELGIQNVEAGDVDGVAEVVDEVLHVRLVIADFGHVLLLGWLGLLLLLHIGKLRIIGILMERLQPLGVLFPITEDVYLVLISTWWGRYKLVRATLVVNIIQALIVEESGVDQHVLSVVTVDQVISHPCTVQWLHLITKGNLPRARLIYEFIVIFSKDQVGVFTF